MDIKLLDKNFNLIEVVDEYSSLIWHRKYYECGSFELYAEMDKFEVFKMSKYIYIDIDTETGVIESLGYGDKKSYIKGRFLESESDSKIIYPVQNLSGTPQNIVLQLCGKFLPDIDREADPQLNTGNMNLQDLGSNLMEKIYELLKPEEMSFRIIYDYENDRKILKVWKGIDRIGANPQNSIAIFAEDFENVVDSKYAYSREELRNFAYIIGEDIEPRIVVQLDLRENPSEQRKELWVDAKDLKKENLSGDIYKQQLYQRGMEKLSEYNEILKVEMNAIPDANMVYKSDYNLGDKCIYIDRKTNLEVEQRITEILETYEASSKKITIKFGEDEKTIKQRIKRSDK